MADIAGFIQQLQLLAPDPERGLPEELLLAISGLTPLVNVDLLVRDAKEGTLLTWRDDRFYGPGWHVPGGIIRYKEPAAERIHAVAREELRADVEFEASPVAIVEYRAPSSGARGHFISLLYRCRLLTPPDPALQFVPKQPRPGHWGWHRHCPENLIVQQQAYKPYIA